MKQTLLVLGSSKTKKQIRGFEGVGKSLYPTLTLKRRIYALSGVGEVIRAEVHDISAVDENPDVEEAGVLLTNVDITQEEIVKKVVSVEDGLK